MSREKNRNIGLLIVAGDFMIFYFSLYLALFIRRGGHPDINIFRDLQEPFFYLFLIWIFTLFIIDFYDISWIRKTVSFLRGIATFSVIATVSGTAYFYFQPQLELTPRAVLFLTVLAFVIISSFWRYVVFKIVGMKNFKKKVFFVGFCEEMKEILKEELVDYEVVGIYTKIELSESLKKKVRVVDTIVGIKEILSDIEILIFAPDTKDDKVLIKKVFSTLPLTMKYVEFFALYEEVTRKVPLRSLTEWWFLENISRPQKRIGETLNRVVEIVSAFLGLIILLPLLLVLSLLIKIDSAGPALYRQDRVGMDGKSFILYKFRTMRHLENEKDNIPWREGVKGEITRIGKILRFTHLDELPQLYNILKGDIGIVGPRPESVDLARDFEEEIPFYRLRYLVRPGLTGWAQINYPPSKNLKEAEEKFRYDLFYIKNRSPFLDLTIVLKTIRTIF